MGSLTRLLGETPRVKLLEALIDLSSVEFSIPEAAEQAGLHKQSAYRRWSDFEEIGLVEEVHEQGGSTWRVSDEDPRFLVAALARDALDEIEWRQREGTDAFEVPEQLKGALERVTS